MITLVWSSVSARNYSSAKAQAELGYSPTPVRKAFEDAYAWYKEHAML